MKHFLLTLVVDDDWVMHAYVIARHAGKTTSVGLRMVNEVERAGYPCPVPLIMVRQLKDDSAIDFVRGIARENPEAAGLMDRADGLHWTAWLLHKDDPRFDKLLELQ